MNIIFEYNKYDELFALSFHKLNKKCKSYCEYSLTKIIHVDYDNLKLNKFKYLRKLRCKPVTKYEDIMELNLKYIDISLCGIKTDLKYINTVTSIKLSNKIKNKHLIKLTNIKNILLTKNITYSAIKSYNLYYFISYINYNLTNNNIKFFYPFRYDICKNIYKIDHMFLNYLDMSFNYFIKGSNIKYMNIYKLVLQDNENILELHIKNMDLHTLDISYDQYGLISSNFIKYKKLYRLDYYTNKHIYYDDVKHIRIINTDLF